MPPKTCPTGAVPRIQLRRHGKTGSRERGFRKTGLSGKGSVFGVLFGLPFFGMGVFFCWIGGLQPLLHAMQSDSWPQVPCTITRSEVESHSSSDGTTYSIGISFRYTYEGREYAGGSYHFSSSSSSGRKGKQRVISRYPVGSEAQCWVNPDKPEQAVLSRDIPGIVWFVIPFSSVFILVGLGIILASLGLLPAKWRDKVRSRHKPVAPENKGKRVLEPTMGGMKKVLGSLVFAAIWNGITGVFLFNLLESFQEGRPQWFLLLFLIPFVLVGIGAIVLFFYYSLALANPGFRLILSEGSPRLGESVELRWETKGSLSRLEDLKIILEGRESATYRRGTRSVTDHSTFIREVVYETERPSLMTADPITVRIPETSMHSFNGGNNRIEWRLRLEGAVRRWPDVSDTYSFTVRPFGIR